MDRPNTRPTATVLALLLLLLPAGAWASPKSPSEADVHEATELLDAWQLHAAMQRAQTLLAERPDDPNVWVLAARVEHQLGEHQAALALLNAAVAAGYPQKQLRTILSLVSSSAQYSAHFQSIETKHFIIHYLNKDEITARYAAPVLEAAYTHIGADLQFYPADKGLKVVVEIYPDAEGLAGATGLTLKEIETSGTIAVCKFHRLMITSPLATADGYSWADTAAHEFTHLIIATKSHNTIPIWLHEGIAKYFESAWDGAPGRDLTPYAQKLLADAVRTHKFITYAQMYPSMAKLPSQKAAALAFAEVFTTIEYLVKTFGVHSIARVLALAGQGVPLQSVFRQVFHMDLAGIEKAWHHYLTHRKFNLVPGAAPRPIRLATNRDDATKERPLEKMDDKQVHDYSRLGELLQLRDHPKAAIIEYEKAYARAGVRYATLIYRLARAYTSVGRSESALGLLSKSLAAHPDDVDSHLLAGRICLKEKQYDCARKHFEAVRLQNPFNPEIHAALAALDQARGDTAAAAQETHFLALSEKPRPTRDYELPSPPAGAARLRVVTVPWGRVRIAGRLPQPTPAWDVPVPAGAGIIEVLFPDGSSKTQSFAVAAGKTKTLVVKEQAQGAALQPR